MDSGELQKETTVKMQKIGIAGTGAAVVFGLVGVSLAALGQQQPFGEMVMEEVIVVAPRMVRREQVDRTLGGGKVERITLTRRVSYEDLDLRLHADVMELEQRVGNMAEEACGQIAEAVPMVDPEPSHEDCVKRATESAMEQVREAVAAAGN